MSRWQIEIPKKKISSTDFNNHVDDIEQSGEQVSGVIKYGILDDKLVIKRRLVYPMFRTQPDDTFASYQLDVDDAILNVDEKFEKVEIDGILHIHTTTKNLKIIHHFYPSTTLPIFYEKIDLENISNLETKIDFEPYKKIAIRLGCEGYIYVERTSDLDNVCLKPKEKVSITFAFTTRFANTDIPKEDNSMEKRMARVKQLQDECDFTCGNDIIDTMFAFAKVRAGESIFKTRKGRIHSPGGTNFYAAIWCNDQCEYSTPWFGFTGDEILKEASLNAFYWFEHYMTDELLPVPSSIISEGTDYWNGAGDRGDASMILFGTSRFMLETGMKLEGKEAKLLDWIYRYVKSQMNEDDIIVSDSDELEGRISSGINLNTSSLSYGGFKYYAELLKQVGRNKEAKEVLELADKLSKGMEKYFGGTVSGYNTYHYHKGCDVIRAWNCLPLYMGIQNRKDDTIKAINEKLWKDGSCVSTENEKIMWDRSALYFIASMFRCDYNELAYSRLLEMSEKRLLGDRVPYVVEAYPENNMRHLSAESALFCRIIVDGLIHIDFKDGLKITPHVPKEISKFSMENIMIEGKKLNIYYNNGKTEIEYL